MDETGTNAKPGPAYPISSVDNALRLVLMLRDQPRLRLSGIAVALGIAPSTAHRLLAMLVHHGFVRQEDGTGAYVAGPALLDLGLAAVRNLDIRTYARPILADLARKTGETVHLAQLEGTKTRYLDAAESGHPERLGRSCPHIARRQGKLSLPISASGNWTSSSRWTSRATGRVLARRSVRRLTPSSPRLGTGAMRPTTGWRRTSFPSP